MSFCYRFFEDRISTPSQFSGHVRFLCVDEKTKEIIRAVEGDNLVTYEGSDVLAKILAGTVTVPVNYVYIEFGNSSPSIPTATRTQGRAYYDALTGGSATDFLRVPLIATPSLTASSTNYSGNQATFTAISNATSGQNGQSFSSGASSEVVGAALVVAPSASDQSQDYVFSRYYLGSTIAKASGQEIVVQWAVTFE
jgi:hypothetical protein